MAHSMKTEIGSQTLQDKVLSRTYATAISRHPERALPGLPSQKREVIEDPIKALENKRKKAAEASKRYRAKSM